VGVVFLGLAAVAATLGGPVGLVILGLMHLAPSTTRTGWRPPYGVRPAEEPAAGPRRGPSHGVAPARCARSRVRSAAPRSYGWRRPFAVRAGPCGRAPRRLRPPRPDATLDMQQLAAAAQIELLQDVADMMLHGP
jgi:hypothetical protein